MKNSCNGCCAAIPVPDRARHRQSAAGGLRAAVAGPWSVGRMPPRFATRLLLATGLTSAVTSLVVLALFSATLVGQVPEVAAVGTWSGEVLHHDDPVSPVVAELAVTALIVRALLAGAPPRRPLAALLVSR